MVIGVVIIFFNKMSSNVLKFLYLKIENVPELVYCMCYLLGMLQYENDMLSKFKIKMIFQHKDHTPDINVRLIKKY